MLGKTGMHEFAYGITSENPHYGAIRNPWDPELMAGGSSGGSAAAVAAALVPMATGTDTGGSIRIPSAFCGTVGLKPTYERVSRRGVLALSLTFDHIGPIARSVRDAAILFHAMTGLQKVDTPEAKVDVRGLRIGVPANFFFDNLDPEVEGIVRNAIAAAQSLGASIREVRVPDMAALNTAGWLLLLAEAATVLRPFVERRAEFGRDTLALLDQGRLISATDYLDAQRLRKIFCAQFAEIWKEADCIFTPCTPTAAPRIGQQTVQTGAITQDMRPATTRFMRSINLLGIPSLAMPVGFNTAGLPVGLQVLAPHGKEAIVLTIGAAIEDALAIAGRMPEGF